MENGGLPSNKLKIRDSQKKENNLVEIFWSIFGDQVFKLFKLALLKRQKNNLICRYISVMTTCTDKLSGSRTEV